MPRLTDIAVKNMPAPATGRTTIWDGKLGLRITANGAKTFVTIIGPGKRYTIGRYGVISLAEARSATTRLHAEKALGRVFPERISFDQAREEYLKQSDIRPNTRAYTERNLNRLKVPLHEFLLDRCAPRTVVTIKGPKGAVEIERTKRTSGGHTLSMSKAEMVEFMEKCAALTGYPLPTEQELQEMGYVKGGSETKVAYPSDEGNIPTKF